jgi:hypothetical protein
MKAPIRFEHRFVDEIPDQLAERCLYVCVPYATAVHLCACGCGAEVVTPFSPTDWALTFDGESVSLRPSIGNWSYPCRSHYVLHCNQIRWAPAWTEDQIIAGRNRDALAKQRYYEPGATRAGCDTERQRTPRWLLLPWRWLTRYAKRNR